MTDDKAEPIMNKNIVFKLERTFLMKNHTVQKIINNASLPEEENLKNLSETLKTWVKNTAIKI